MLYTINIQVYSLKKYRCDILKYQTIIPTNDQDYLDFCIVFLKSKVLDLFQKNNPESEVKILDQHEKNSLQILVNAKFKTISPLQLINDISNWFTQENI